MIASTVNRMQYVGAGSTGPYPFSFRIFAATDLQVTKRSSVGALTTLAYMTDFVLAPGTSVGDAAGGNITLTVALAVSETLTIRRVLPLLQPTSLSNQGPYFGATHEGAFDRLVMIDQQQQDTLDRSLQLAPSLDPAGYNLTVLAPENGKVLTGTGTGLTWSTLDGSAVALPGDGRTVGTLTAYLANNSVLSVKDFGAIGDGTAHPLSAYFGTLAAAQAVYPAAIALTDQLDWAAAMKALAASVATGRPAVVLDKAQLYTGTRTLTVVQGASFLMSPTSMVIYSGTGVSILLDSLIDTSVVDVRTKCETKGWKTGADLTSVGVRVRNTFRCKRIAVGRSEAFAIGFELYGDNAGVSENDIFLNEIHGNKRAIVHTKVGAGGYTNHNNYFGGYCRLDSEDTVGGLGTPIAGTRYIDLSADGNGNNFFGLEIEGGSVEKNIEVAIQYNVFWNCRLESVLKVHFLAGSYANLIIGGYGNPGYFDGVIFVDDAGANQMIGGFGSTMVSAGTEAGGTSQPARTVRMFTSVTGVVDRIWDNANAEQVMVTRGDGTIRGYKHLLPTNPWSILDTRLAQWFTGDGVAVPTVLWSWDATVPAMAQSKDLRMLNSGGRIRYQPLDIADGNATPTFAASLLLRTLNTAPTTITSFLGQPASGSDAVIGYLIVRDVNTTLGTSGNIKTRTGGSMLLKTGTVEAFLWHAGNGQWIQMGPNANTPAVTPFVQAYSAAITPNANSGDLAIITPTNAVAFVLNLPTNLRKDQVFLVRIVNTTAGALGGLTGGANVKLGAWVQPAAGFNRTVEFHYDGTNLVEMTRGSVDVPN